MQARTKQGLQTLVRAQLFLNGREFSVALGDLKPHVDALAALVKRLEEHATEQDSRDRSARTATEAKRALGHALRQEYLRPIEQVARGLFPSDANLRATFKLPAGRDDVGLLQTARGVAERAAEYQSLFIAKGLAPDFVERLRKATTAFGDALGARGLDIARRSAASAGMLQELTRGRDLLRLLDIMVVPRLRGQSDQLAEWRSITRFMRKGVVEVVPGGEGGTAPSEGTPSGGTPNGGTAPSGGTPTSSITPDAPVAKVA